MRKRSPVCPAAQVGHGEWTAIAGLRHDRRIALPDQAPAGALPNVKADVIAPTRLATLWLGGQQGKATAIGRPRRAPIASGHRFAVSNLLTLIRFGRDEPDIAASQINLDRSAIIDLAFRGGSADDDRSPFAVRRK